jgi:hypothetical protein
MNSEGFEPCPSDTPCENCEHPMSGHFHETPTSWGTGCAQCQCKHWACKHGGMRTGIRH